MRSEIAGLLFGVVVALCFCVFAAFWTPPFENDPQPTAPATSIYQQGRPTE